MNRSEKKKYVNENSTEEFVYHPVEPIVLKLGDCWDWINEILGFKEGEEIPVKRLTDAMCNEMLRLYVQSQNWQGERWECEDVKIYWDEQCEHKDYPELSKIQFGWDIEDEYEDDEAEQV